MLLSSAIRSDPQRTVLITDCGPISCADLDARADQILQHADFRSASNCLVHSSQPADVVTALLICERAQRPLYIAHSYLPSDHLEAVIREQGIDLVLGSGLNCRRVAGPPTSHFHGFQVCLMTSGTTGLPKIARHSLKALTGRIRTHSERREPSRWLLTYPASSFAGLQVVLTAVLSGDTLACPEDHSIKTLVRCAGNVGVTHISGTPTFWRGVLLALGGTSLPGLRQITIGGEVVDQTTLDRLRVRFPEARITHIYASTEAGAVFAVSDGRAGFPSDWLRAPFDDVELDIREGLLWVRTPRRMLGYVSTHQAIGDAGTWLCTGDRIRVESDRTYFTGRSDQIINVGGSKVWPDDVETVIRAVQGVVDCRVSGVASPISGKVLVAEVVIAPEMAADGIRRTIISQCRAKLASFQVPRVIRTVPEITLAPSGKKQTEGGL